MNEARANACVSVCCMYNMCKDMHTHVRMDMCMEMCMDMCFCAPSRFRRLRTVLLRLYFLIKSFR